jgi:phosphoglycerate dehydrogenase-like enzyme
MGQPQGKALLGKTVGIVGLGGIGRALAVRLQTFGVRIHGIRRTHPRKAKEELDLDWAGGPEDLPQLLQEADFVVLCTPLTAQTRNLMSARSFEWMKNGSFLINLSRGGLVDREALKQALASGRIAGAGLDVFWEEPPDPADPIFNYNVLATPHIAGSTDVSMSGILSVVAENIRRLERGQEPRFLQYPES